MREINTSLFERDYLSIISEVFSSASAPPENATNADKSAGADYVNHHLMVPQSDSGEISPTNIERRLTREEVLKMKKMTQNPSGLILTQRKKRVTSLVVRLRMNSK